LKKKLSILIALVMAITLCLTPAVASAEDVGLSGTIYTGYLDLENKDYTTWGILDEDNIGGTLGYNTSGPTFDWGLEATVLTDGTYALIYYADFTGDRFGDWGGNNPGAVISNTIEATGGIISTSGSIDLSMDLPCPPDANQFEISYSGFPDFYDHAHGAKIWLVPVSALSGGSLPVTAWPPDDNWLFETDLITYSDTDDGPSTIVAISLDRTAIDFGVMQAGEVADGGSIAVTNDGTVSATVTASVSGSAFSGLMLKGGAVGAYSPEIPVLGDDVVAVTLLVPAFGAGTYTGTLTFIATGPVPTP